MAFILCQERKSLQEDKKSSKTIQNKTTISSIFHGGRDLLSSGSKFIIYLVYCLLMDKYTPNIKIHLKNHCNHSTKRVYISYLVPDNIYV